MVWFQFMLLMMNDLFDIIKAFIKDIEDASPNLKNNLNEIYPIKFKLVLDGHKDIYLILEENKKNITFNEITDVDFEIRTSVKEALDFLISKKINRGMLYGDSEKAILTINAFLKAEVDIVFLIDKYFGNTPAALAYFTKEKLFNRKQYNKENALQSKLRGLSIRLDRLEAISNL
ncbi:hypothetical protein N9Z21_00465 [Gammaproteobacteria bacterium]|nr:hypothetical protein [Gammaproteobacteria bacterium]MDB2447570.1 hypothetical protein [Gammaproteobacteria bacterium]MDB2703867.1 hypothetical protein [Gammaproteobacteria bacterium]